MTGFIGHSELAKLLASGQIFRSGTWTSDQLRGASYDVRAARDGLKDPSGKEYSLGEDRPERTLHLEQGAVALLSSEEQLCLPWNVAGIMGIKFGLARQGVLMLTGIAIDPGFGLRLHDGKWEARENSRVHFLVTNVGEGPVSIELGKDAVASIQFTHVEEPTNDMKMQLSAALSRPWAENAKLATKGLGFFRVLETLRHDHEELASLADTERRETASALQNLRRELSITRELTNSLVNLGVFVVLTTVFLGAVGVIFGVAQSSTLSAAMASFIASLPTEPTSGLITLALILLAALFVVSASRVTTAWIRRGETRPSETQGPGSTSAG